MEVLNEIEKFVNQQEIFENINPALKSFFRGNKAQVEAGIEALLSLITHDNPADLLDFIREREGI